MPLTLRPLTLRLLPLLLCAGAASAAPDGSVKTTDTKGTDQQRNELRDAVESHRTAKRDEVQRDEAAAGRRLTAAERAELREQLRRQWVASSATPHPVETQPAERIAPTPIADAAPSRNLVPVARSQRP